MTYKQAKNIENTYLMLDLDEYYTALDNPNSELSKALQIIDDNK